MNKKPQPTPIFDNQIFSLSQSSTFFRHSQIVFALLRSLIIALLFVFRFIHFLGNNFRKLEILKEKKLDKRLHRATMQKEENWTKIKFY